VSVRSAFLVVRWQLVTCGVPFACGAGGVASHVSQLGESSVRAAPD